MNETIKEYLVGLGFKVDDASYRKLAEVLGKVEGLVNQHTTGIVRSYGLAATAVATSIGSLITSTVSLLDTVAQADLGYQKFALRMHMTRDAAKQLKIVTDAMGESMEDIAWIPELRGRYFELMKQAQTLETPRDAAGQLMYLRDIRYEFTRLKVEAVYGLQWIGYNLYRHLFKPITETKSGFKEFNDYITANIPKWSDKIASWLAQFVVLGTDVIQLLARLSGSVGDLWNVMSKGEKVGAGLLVLGALFAWSGPFGRAVILFSSLTLLINDFYTHLRGGDSLLGPGWDKMLDKVKDIEMHFYMIGRYAGAAWDVLAGKEGAAARLYEISGKSGAEKMRKEFEEMQVQMINSGNYPAHTKEYYLGKGTGKGYDSFIEEASRTHGVDKDLIKAVIQAESAFNAGAVSKKGAMGLMQLMPGTAKDLGVMDPYDPRQNIMRGTRYIKQLLDRYGGDTEKALAAYNWGMGNVDRGGQYPAETLQYLESIMKGTSLSAQGMGSTNNTQINATINVSGVSSPELAAEKTRDIILGLKLSGVMPY